MKSRRILLITILTLLIMSVGGAFFAFAEGTATQDSYKGSYTVGSFDGVEGTIILKGIYTDSELTAEEAIDFTANFTTSGTLNKSYCFSVKINSLFDDVSISSIKADFEDTGLPNANQHNIELSQSGDNPAFVYFGKKRK